MLDRRKFLNEVVNARPNGKIILRELCIHVDCQYWPFHLHNILDEKWTEEELAYFYRKRAPQTDRLIQS